MRGAEAPAHTEVRTVEPGGDDEEDMGASESERLSEMRVFVELLRDAQARASDASLAVRALGFAGDPNGIIARVGALENALIELRRNDVTQRDEMLKAQQKTTDTLVKMSERIGAITGGKWYERAAVFLGCCSLIIVAAIVVLQYLQGMR